MDSPPHLQHWHRTETGNLYLENIKFLTDESKCNTYNRMTSVVLGIPHFSQVFLYKNQTLPKAAMQHGFNPISSIYVMCCEKR
jgi:hypothetical protein